MKYSDKQRLEKIRDYCTKLQAYMAESRLDRAALMTGHTVQWTVTTPLYNIGEQVYNLSGELKAAHPEVPWSMISGLRHRLVHDYEGTNWSIIVEVVFDELPVFAKAVEAILKDL